jgi:hypothetical protein
MQNEHIYQNASPEMSECPNSSSAHSNMVDLRMTEETLLLLFLSLVLLEVAKDSIERFRRICGRQKW